MRPSRRYLVAAWVGVGLAGSLVLTAANSELQQGHPVQWWLDLHLGSRPFCHHVFWAGVIAMCLAWVGIGVELSARRDGGAPLSRRTLLIAGGLWATPLVLGPALLSGDMFSYLAQGDLLRHGIDPYHHGPAALATVHQAGVLSTVSPFWRHSSAPYGPLFVGLAAVVSLIAGTHFAVAVVLFRLIELAGLGLLAIYVPRIATRLGAEPERAIWLAVISPLVLIETIGGGHNDALMAGLLAAGVSFALERRPVLAIAVCALAAAVKLPAVVAIPVIAACWLREEAPLGSGSTPELRAAQVRIVASTVATVGVVLLAVGLVTTVNVSWISSGLLSSTGKLHLALTPGTAVGETIHQLFGGSAHHLESICVTLATVCTAIFGLAVLARVRYERLPLLLGLLLLASVFGGPAAWPWYLTWGVALVAADPRAQRWTWLPAFMVVACFVIWPSGQLALPGTDSPQVLAVYSAPLIGFLAFLLTRRLRARRGNELTSPAVVA